MNLLPRSHTEFSTIDYWETFFKARGSKAFEWYGEYTDLCSVIHQYIKPKDKILHIGCGNSDLSYDLYEYSDIKNIINVDISEVAINLMQIKNTKVKTSMKFLVMDATQMSFGNDSFTVVLDKGTLDALAVDDSDETKCTVHSMFSEIARVLKIGGRYICFSLAQKHVVSMAMEYFAKIGFMTRIIPMSETFKYPVFVYIFTKFRYVKDACLPIEMCNKDGQPVRYKTISSVLNDIDILFEYNSIKKKIKAWDKFDDDFKLELYSTMNTQYPRFILKFAVNKSIKAKNEFVVFVVPQGRELEWMFFSPEGRSLLCQETSSTRVAMVILHRFHKFDSMASVQKELSHEMVSICPQHLRDYKIAFLTMGSELSCRQNLHQGYSKMSGEYFVEHINFTEQDKTYRHLVFKVNTNVIQSQIRMKKVTEKRRKKGKTKVTSKLVLDLDYLAPSYCSIIVGSLSLLQNSGQLYCTLVGLGGGVLPMYIVRHMETMHIECVELDPHMQSIAYNWFGFSTNNFPGPNGKDKVSLKICDGIDHIKNLLINNVKRHMVIIDADCKEISEGLTGPPPAFITNQMLYNMYDLLLPEGILVMNLVCRNVQKRDDLLTRMKKIFPLVLTCKLCDDVNEVVIGMGVNHPILKESNQMEYLRKTVEKFQARMLKNNPSLVVDDIDLVERMAGITIC